MIINNVSFFELPERVADNLLGCQRENRGK